MKVVQNFWLDVTLIISFVFEVHGRGGIIPGGANSMAVSGGMENSQFPKRELISVRTGSPLSTNPVGLNPYFRRGLVDVSYIFILI